MKHLIVVCLVLLTGCGGPPPPPEANGSLQMAEINREQADDILVDVLNEDEIVLPSRAYRSRQVVVSDAAIKLKSESPDSVHRTVISLALNNGGYVLRSTNDQTAIRLLAERFHDAVDEILVLGEVLDKEITGKDVTEQYRDLQIRLENAMKTRERYLTLLGKAKSVQEIARIETELERVNTGIETLKGKINRLSHLTLYSTITVDTRTPLKPGVVARLGGWVYGGIKGLFVSN